MTKQNTRLLFKSKRLEISASQKMKFDDLLLIQLQKLVLPAEIKTLLSYWPLEHQKEPDTHLYTNYLELIFQDIQIAYPVTEEVNHTMNAVLTDSNSTFSVNKYGIYEPQESNCIVLQPQEIDLVFVPLLAVDKLGYRVGYGKGYYDRYLPNCKPDIIKIGFSYFEPIDCIEDTNQYDVPLNYCITPEWIYEF